MELLIIIKILISHVVLDMVIGSPNGLKNNRALENDQEFANNKITKGEIFQSSSFIRKASFNIVPNQHFPSIVALQGMNDPFGG